MPRTHPKYPPEFRAEAVRLVRTTDKTVEAVSEDLGISYETLRSQLKRDDIDAGRRDGLTTEEREELRHLRKENRTLRMERDLLKKAGGILRSGGDADLRFTRAERANFPVRFMCRHLRGSPSGFYSWCSRPVSHRRARDLELAEKITEIHEASFGTYGAPRIWAELTHQGERLGRKRVARIMREEGICGAHVPRRYRRTKRSGNVRPLPDLVNRDLTAEAPNRRWVADITYCETDEGFAHPAAVIDLYSRAAVGWSIASHPRAELVLG